jgi:hypothetical protein
MDSASLSIRAIPITYKIPSTPIANQYALLGAKVILASIRKIIRISLEIFSDPIPGIIAGYLQQVYRFSIPIK